MEATKDGSNSICCDESRAPIVFHWYEDKTDPTPVETLKRLLAELSVRDFDIDRFVGDFRARIKRATQGRLFPIDNVIGPMDLITNYQMFEIRWRFEYSQVSVVDDLEVQSDFEIRVRMYHVEPKMYRPTFVALHLHVKDTTDGVDVRGAQDDEIRIADKRYWAGKESKWGIPA